MTKCYICNRRPYKTNNLSFHRFPADENLKQKWFEVIGKDEPPPEKRASVCSIHFTEDCFRYGLVYGMRRIKEDAIPSLYLQETEEETEMLNQLHRSSVNQTLDEVINTCHSENSEGVMNAGGNPPRVAYQRRRPKNKDPNRQKESEVLKKRVKLNLTWEQITSAPGGGKRYWETAQRELSLRKSKIERLQVTLRQTRMKLRKVQTAVKELKKSQCVTIYVQEECSDNFVST